MREIEDTSQIRNQKLHNTSKLSFRGLFAVTAAFALWIGLLADFRREPLAIVFFWTLAVVAGIVGHLLYRYLLPWRGTVVIGLLVIPFLIFTALFGNVDDVLDFVLIPIDLFLHQTWGDRLRSTIPTFVWVLVLTAAHPFRPSLSSAIISAIGVSLWYGMAIMIASNAG